MNLIEKMVEKFIELHKRLRRWRRVLFVLSAITVFSVTYALILPAITLDKNTAAEQPGIETDASETAGNRAVAGEEADQAEAEDAAEETVEEPAEEPEAAAEEEDPVIEEDTDSEDSADAGASDTGDADSSDSDDADANDSEGADDGEDADAADTEDTVAEDTDDEAADEGSAGEGASSEDADTADTEEAGTADTEDAGDESATAGTTVQAGEAAEELELITEDTQLVFEGEDYLVYADFGASAKLPVGVVLDVKEITKEEEPELYEEYYNKAQSKMQDEYDENTKLSFAKFYDIAFKYEDKEIEPAGEVKVRIEYKEAFEIPTETTLDAVHFDKNDEENTKVLKTEIESKDKETRSEGKNTETTEIKEVESIEFKSEQFSVYGVVGTESITTTFLTADGSTYEVTVNFGTDAGIGSDAQLLVRELTQEDADYNSYVEQTASAIDSDKDALSYIKLLDISIADKDGQKITLSAPVDVQIRLLDKEELGETTKIVHFAQDEGKAEAEPEVLERTIEGDTVRFETSGFSAYAIVEGPEAVSIDWHKIQTFEDLIAYGSTGLCIGHVDGYYFGNELVADSKRTGIKKTKPDHKTGPVDGAAKYYFEQVEGSSNQVYAYCFAADGVTKQYVYNGGNNSLSFTTEDSKTAFTVTVNNGVFTFQNGSWYWNMQGGANGARFCSYNTNGDPNSNMYLWYREEVTSDPYDLDGTSYGLMNWNGGVAGKALMGSGAGNKLDAKALITMRTTNDKKHLFVPNDSEISMWTFHWLDEDNYYLTTVVDGSTKYLRIGENGLSLVSEPDDNCRIQVVPGTGTRAGQICLKSGNTTLTFSGTVEGGFSVGGSAGSEWLNLVELSELTSEYFLTYSAQKVSVSDPTVTTGSRVIVYTRSWNETTLSYDYYAISSDGTVIPVYENGDTIEWTSGQINTLLWNFVEYTWEGTTDPNFYYELYNQYSEKYLAPQVTDGQILSDDTIGINLNGRRAGKYQSTILAWDEDNYSYAGLKVENGQIVSCPKSESMDFYFAIMQDLNVDDDLHTVPTVDHTQYGITMKIINIDTREEMSGILGNNDGGAGRTLHQGLLATKLEDDGYPITKANHSLGELYAGENEVNHLFIQSVYNETGYFEFDSTQNFATLNGNDGGDFTVYNELGTHDDRSSNTLKHGQFFPFNTLKAGTFSSLNPKNLYTFDETSYEKLLPDSDPRKYEKLYTVNHDGETPDYYFATELEASFTQTPSGVDAWGHDIIFEFTGDDDFWLYVDGELVIDLGGIHSSVPGSVNFRTGDVRVNGKPTTLRDLFYNNYLGRDNHTAAEAEAYVNSIFVERVIDGRTCYVFDDYTNHDMKIFYMERGAGASNINMKFNLAAVKKGTAVLTKELTGVEDPDSVMAEFPYQIYYKTGDGTEHLLRNSTGGPGSAADEDYVIYKDSINPVKYKPSLVIDGVTYEHVFFLKPGEEAEISFPEEMTEYRIVECGVNTEVYEKVTVNKVEIPGTSGQGYAENRKDFGISYDTTNNRSRVNYVNEVDPDAMQELTVEKQLYAEDGVTPIPYSENLPGFNFHLYLATEYDDDLDAAIANMQTYYVKDPDGNYCRWDKSQKKFVSLSKTDFSLLTEEEKKAAAFETSIYGAITGIPVDYKVEIRDVLAGTQFKVVERPALIPDGYSFQRYVYNGTDSENEAAQGISGAVESGEDSEVIVRNLKGFGLRVNKTWSDKEYMSDRDAAYFAIYINEGGTLNLVDGTVMQMPYTDKEQTLYWYFDKLERGVGFEQYMIREVKIVSGVPAVDDEGYVTNAGQLTIEPLPDGAEITMNGRQKGETESSSFDYTVLYGNLDQNDNVRIQEVTNNRPGIVLRKAKWDGTTPLAGAEFELKDNDGNLIGSFVSGEDGMITTAFLRDNVPYTLTETEVPQGWYGLQAPLTITLDSGSISVGEGSDPSYYIIDNESATPSLTIKNRPYTFQAVKKDGDSMAVMQGVKFALHKQVVVDGVITIDLNPMPGYEELVTDENGLIPGIDNTLPPGTYELREKSTLGGYEMLSGYIDFTISEMGAISLIGTDQKPIPEGVTLTGPTEESGGSLSYEMEILNHRLADVTLKKVDNSNKPLAGARFKLCKYTTSWEVVDGYEDIDMTQITSVTFVDLGVGRYRLTEMKAPDGYIVTCKDTYFTLDFGTGGNVRVTLTDEAGTGMNPNPDASVSGTTITVKNTPGTPLPMTGGTGTSLYTLGGLALILAGALMFILKMRLTGKEAKQ